MISLLFYVFAALALISGLGIILTKNVLYAAFMLIITFLSIAGIYVLAFADFVAITQIIVYAGGILILLVFGVMLTNRISEEVLISPNQNIFWGILGGGGLAVFLVTALFRTNPDEIFWIENMSRDLSAGTIKQIGVQLMSDYILHFELVGILLLIALVGAAFLAKKEPEA